MAAGRLLVLREISLKRKVLRTVNNGQNKPDSPAGRALNSEVKVQSKASKGEKKRSKATVATTPWQVMGSRWHDNSNLNSTLNANSSPSESAHSSPRSPGNIGMSRKTLTRGVNFVEGETHGKLQPTVMDDRARMESIDVRKMLRERGLGKIVKVTPDPRFVKMSNGAGGFSQRGGGPALIHPGGAAAAHHPGSGSPNAVRRRTMGSFALLGSSATTTSESPASPSNLGARRSGVRQSVQIGSVGDQRRSVAFLPLTTTAESTPDPPDGVASLAAASTAPNEEVLAPPRATQQIEVEFEEGKLLLQISVLQPFQYYGHQQILHSKQHPVTLLVDGFASLYTMGRTDMVRRLPKRLLLALSEAETFASPNDHTLYHQFLRNERWAQFKQAMVLKTSDGGKKTIGKTRDAMSELLPGQVRAAANLASCDPYAVKEAVESGRNRVWKAAGCSTTEQVGAASSAGKPLQPDPSNSSRGPPGRRRGGKLFDTEKEETVRLFKKMKLANNPGVAKIWLGTSKGGQGAHHYHAGGGDSFACDDDENGEGSSDEEWLSGISSAQNLLLQKIGGRQSFVAGQATTIPNPARQSFGAPSACSPSSGLQLHDLESHAILEEFARSRAQKTKHYMTAIEQRSSADVGGLGAGRRRRSSAFFFSTSSLKRLELEHEAAQKREEEERKHAAWQRKRDVLVKKREKRLLEEGEGRGRGRRRGKGRAEAEGSISGGGDHHTADKDNRGGATETELLRDEAETVDRKSKHRRRENVRSSGNTPAGGAPRRSATGSTKRKTSPRQSPIADVEAEQSFRTMDLHEEADALLATLEAGGQRHRGVRRKIEQPARPAATPSTTGHRGVEARSTTAPGPAPKVRDPKPPQLPPTLLKAGATAQQPRLSACANRRPSMAITGVFPTTSSGGAAQSQGPGAQLSTRNNRSSRSSVRMSLLPGFSGAGQDAKQTRTKSFVELSEELDPPQPSPY
eukprot:g7033.t1